MHEFAAIQRIIAAITSAAKQNGISRIKKVKMRIGRMTAVTLEQLQAGLKTFSKGTCLENAHIEIEEVNVRLKCNQCGDTFADTRFDRLDFAHIIAHAPRTYVPPICPNCKTETTTVINGQEMDLLNIQGD